MTDLTNKQLETLVSDAKLREVYQLRVYVVGGGFQYLQMFEQAGFKGARDVEDCDIVCFTGGEDVDPDLYGQKPLPQTNFNRKRDDFESNIYGEALMEGKPMIGICRGAQFLNVMNGGKLWQHVNNHAISGKHAIVDVASGTVVQGMTSTHHQMMRPTDDGLVLALAELSTKKEDGNEVVDLNKPKLEDVEVVWYKDNMTLCFQPHPEFAVNRCRKYFLDLVDTYIMENCGNN